MVGGGACCQAYDSSGGEGGKEEARGGGGAEGWVQQSLSLVRTLAKTAFKHIMEGHGDAVE